MVALSSQRTIRGDMTLFATAEAAPLLSESCAFLIVKLSKANCVRCLRRGRRRVFLRCSPLGEFLPLPPLEVKSCGECIVGVHVGGEPLDRHDALHKPLRQSSEEVV